MSDFREEAQGLYEQLVRWRRDLHRHPELAFEETRTAEIVATHLEQLGMEVQRGVGKTGVVGILEGGREGKTVMLRFDMDALPIEEANEVDYASQEPGKMHACGHDGHTAIGLGVATLLARHRQQLTGRVKLVFQPAEEISRGARAMIDDGVLKDPAPDVVMGLHLWNSLPVGRAAVQPGPFMAAAAHFRLTVQGQGGHGALPHQTIDPVVTAAHLVTAIQTIVSRNLPPMQPAVVSVGTFHAGTAANVIPDRAELTGTIRTLDDQVARQIEDRLHQLARQITQAFGATYHLEVDHATPVVVNDPTVTEHLTRIARRQLGEEAVESVTPLMVSEDVSEFLRRVPGCYFFLGSQNLERDLRYPHHHPRFDFDEAALPLGVGILVEATVAYLNEHADS